MEWQDWSAALVGYNPSLRSAIDPATTWEDFGKRLALVDATAPRPDYFETWEAWAMALKRAIPS